MKIKGIHSVCRRELLIDQVVASGGRCPWDGLPLTTDYAPALVSALQRAQLAGSALENALDQVVEVSGTLTLEEESVLGGLRAILGRMSTYTPVQPGQP